MFERDQLSSRRSFLGQSALASAGVLAIGALTLPALPARALSFAPRDARTLEFLRRLQVLQSEFFAQVLASTTADGLREGEGSLFSIIGQQDSEQKRWCEMALRQFAAAPNVPPSTLPGGIKMNRFKFGSLAMRHDLFVEALNIKTTAAGAWTGAVSSANKGELASAIASLAGVQNRHRTSLATVLGVEALPAYAPALSMRDAMIELQRYGFSMEDVA